MITLKHKHGTIEKMTLKEFGARLWPFGKWCIVWEHITEGKQPGKNIANKLTVINSFIMLRSAGSTAMKVVGIKKIGGLFDGTEFRPRTKEDVI